MLRSATAYMALMADALLYDSNRVILLRTALPPFTPHFAKCNQKFSQTPLTANETMLQSAAVRSLFYFPG